MTKLSLSLIILSASLLFSCSGNKEITPAEEAELHIFHEKVTVEAVYYHESGRYSVAVLDGNELKMTRLPSGNHRQLTPKIFVDVPAGQNSWYEIKYEKESEFSDIREIYFGKDSYKIKPFIHIHIHDVNDLNNAGWNHGKFGRGQTVKID